MRIRELARSIAEDTAARILLRAVVISLFSAAATPAAAGAQRPIELPELSGPVELDGPSQEAAWEAIDPLPMVMHWPRYHGTMTERTEVRIAYDEEYLWIAGRLYDSDPSGIRANSLYRDRWDGDDAFDLVIDSFNDDQTALKFTTTPLGILLDQEIRNDAEEGGGQRPINDDWDTFWDVESRVTDEGWFFEMRIPFRSLGFEPRDGKVVMGVIASRYISRKNERHIFPDIPPEWGLAAFKPSQARDVSLADVESRPPLYVTPYVLTGLDRTAAAGSTAPPEAETTGELGFDVKYGISNNLTLDLTANTDFAQVEADDQRVNLTRFNLFFPEKRQFFQERSAIFQFNHGDEGRLFHSRRIGLTEDGQPLRILGGARLVGRLGSWDVGLLDMQVEGAPGRPGENTGVLRLRRSVLNPGSTVGGMVTSRITNDGHTDLAYGLDASINPFGDDQITLQWAQSHEAGDDANTSGERSAGSFLDASLARVFWQRPSEEGWGYDLEAARSGQSYDPGLGFEERNAFTAFKTRLSYAWQPGAESRVSRHKAFTTSRLFLRNGDGAVESALQRFRWSTEFESGDYLNVALNLEYEDLDEPLTLSEETIVPAGSYFGPNLFVFYATSRGDPLYANGFLHAGTFLDGWRGRLALRPGWVVSPHLSLNLEYDLNRLFFPRRDQRFDADIARFRVRAALDTRLSAESFLQYNLASDRLAGNVRLRYRFAEGRDLFVVYDETRDLGSPELEDELASTADRRVLLKYRYTFHP